MKKISLDTKVTVVLNLAGEVILEEMESKNYAFFTEEHPFPQHSENGTVTMTLRDLIFIFGEDIGNGIQLVPDPIEEIHIEE